MQLLTSYSRRLRLRSLSVVVLVSTLQTFTFLKSRSRIPWQSEEVTLPGLSQVHAPLQAQGSDY